MEDHRARHRGGPLWALGGPPRVEGAEGAGRGASPVLRICEARRGSGAVPWPSTLLVAVLVLVGTGFAAKGQDREQLDAIGRVLLLLGPALLLLRNRWPVVSVFGTAATTLLYLGAGYPYGPAFVPLAVAVFAAVVSGHRHAAWWALGGFWTGSLLLAHWLYRYLPPSGDQGAPWGQEVAFAAWIAAVLAAAELVRLRGEALARARVERARAENRRADEERLRIARELHDVLAHSISVINVQAGVGLALLDSDPEQARTALTTIKAASKEALGEVRQVLDRLRTPGAAPRAPVPGLDRLPELAEQAASAGLKVTVTREGKAEPLPPGTDLAAFRIVQEALTNVVRHSGSRAARVGIVRIRGRLVLRIDDDGPATGSDAGGSGNGLAGMRERAAALGGTIDACERSDGGFRVVADLPVRSPGDDAIEREAR
ncbi:sensor histidine kinase [Streptomyces albipurpureus]|uniref:sensor histidine kinase n=1 Tax=Streptomyces albipurpureus TaxID=2897419 RepID=UPI003CE48864